MQSLLKWKISTGIGFGVFIAVLKDCFLVITLGSSEVQMKLVVAVAVAVTTAACC